MLSVYSSDVQSDKVSVLSVYSSDVQSDKVSVLSF